MTNILALAVGSLAGGFGRYYLAEFIYHVCGVAFPYGTLAVNALGCFLIGVFSSLSEKHLIDPAARLLLIVGFCGAFTTFSTFILETANLIKAGEAGLAFINVLVSVAIGFVVFYLGILLGEAF